ncbi:MAG: MFS transporter [Deltaproteobacteria bacterium]|nr:MFS transporter [Deltaproteobacteria bacterium]
MPLSLTTRSLLILTSLNLLDYLDRYLVASLGSLIKADLNLSDKAFGFLGTAFFLVYLVTSPLFGYLGDRGGRLRLMAGGAVLWSLATSLTYWVPSYLFLVVTRGLVGVGEASFGTLAPAYLADILPLGRRARALGLFYLALPAGAALAYLVGALVGSHWGWRPAFLLAGLPGLAMAGLIYRLGEVRPEPATGEKPPPIQALLTASWHLFKVPTLRRVTLGYGMVTFALGGLAFWMPCYLEVAKGISLSQANLLLFGSVALAGGLGTLTGGLLGSRLLTYTLGAPLWVSGLGIVLAIPLAAVAIFVAAPALYIPALAGAIFLLFLNPGVLTAVVVSVAGPWRRAQAVALNIVVIHLVGDVPSPLLIGWISDLGSLKWGVSLTLVALAAGAVLILSALPHLKGDLAAAGEIDLKAEPPG